MRVEPFGIDSFVHVVKRGARGLPITRDKLDRKRFQRLLYYLNDEYQSEFWELDVKRLGMFDRPKQWPARDPLVDIIAWTLMPNHFHLLLRETQENGVSRFMQRLCGSMSRHFNEKYDEHGSIFQGSYRSRTIDSDRYLRWAIAYIAAKNVFELYPGGFARAIQEFEKAWGWAQTYEYSSLAAHAGKMPSPILNQDVLAGYFKSSQDFKNCARDMLLSRKVMGDAPQSVLFE